MVDNSGVPHAPGVSRADPQAPGGGLVAEIRDRYTAAAVAAGSDGCCGGDSCGPTADEPGFGAQQYSDTERGDLPGAAVAASLGCGNPTAVADLTEGDRVLDLGSGGGIDLLLSSQRVGPTGRVYGLDMTDEMLALARRNITEAGATNVELLRGRIEDIPLPADTVDVVISNCVINLSVDKPAVLAEMHRVLRPGGRVGVTDVVTEDRLTPAERAERGGWVGCVAGAMSITEYEQGLRTAGFTDISVTFTHEAADGVHSAIVKATKPATG